jgi:pseudouridine synthase
VAVNGRVAALGALVDPGRDGVAVDGRPVPAELPRRTLMLNKPVGVVSTRRDPGGRPTVLDLVEDARGLFPVGRLDSDSHGLLLLTTDGELALRLTHPRHGVRKRYLVAVRGHAGAAALRTLVAGVRLEDGPARALSARVAGARRGDTVLELEMGEGRRREVRRLCAAAGLVVTDLERVGLGPLRLGRLAEGSSRRLRPAEEAALHEAVGLPLPARVSGPG